MTRGWPATFIVALTASTALGACASVAPPAPASTTPPGPERERPTPATSREQSSGDAELARAAHVLNRLAFGPRPGDVERVARMGVERWISQQLRPESIVDSAGAAALKGCEIWTEPVEAAVARLWGPVSFRTEMRMPGDGGGMRMVGVSVVGPFIEVVSRDSASRAGALGPAYLDTGQFLACRLTRVEASEQQLLEVLTDFWENHFSVYGNRLPSRGSLVEWDRAVIRPNALGRFRVLLGAVAHSPSMLEYLDNAANTAQAPNENYGRELLELHTLGADGGYTQADVIDVSRAFTGWTHTRSRVAGPPTRLGSSPVLFEFDLTKHDTAAKVVLGRTLPAGRGIADGEEVLDLLARHPSTARFIARKLAVRFVSDAPPAALVERAAATYLRTDGDIREVVRTIVTSPEFFSPEAYGVKIKSPQELVLSTRRALAAPVETAAELIDLLVALDQRPFSRAAPDGWPETGAPWMNFGAMLARFELASRIAQGKVASIPVDRWPGWTMLVDQTFDTQVDGVIRFLLNGQVSQETRAAMLGGRPPTGDRDIVETRRSALVELLALALSSPEFQRR